MGKGVFFMGFTLLLLFGCASSASTEKIVNGFVSNAVSALMKWLWSLQATTKTAITSRPLMKFEDGYSVETVFDGSKLGIEPHSIEVLPNGELLILDADNSNIYRISSSLSLYSRPKLVAGSPEGFTGHVDGKLREARFNRPKSIAIDDRGNIYVADNLNQAIRKISNAGVTTIAGGKGRHVDGPSEDAKFSNDLDIVYVGSSCSLLVVDRGNRAIREIQLHFDDCGYQYVNNFPLGIAVLVAAGLFGYVLALLQRRVGTIVSSRNDHGTTKASIPRNTRTNPTKPARPLLTPTEDGNEKQEESFLRSTRKLLANAGSPVIDVLRSTFLRKKHQPRTSSTWPMQDSFVIPEEDEPPSIDTRTPTPRKTYPFMSKDGKSMHQLRQSKAFYDGYADFQHQNQHNASTTNTYYEQSCGNVKEIVFGAMQELDEQCGAVSVKPVSYGDSYYRKNL